MRKIVRIGMGRHLGRTAACLSLATLLAVGGCPTPAGSDGGSGTGSTNIDATANNTFGAAPDFTPANNKLSLSGTIDTPDDFDLFKVPNLNTGDHVLIDVQAVDNTELDPVGALFDAQERVHAFNDDRVPDASNLNPLIDVTIRGPSGDYFVGVAPFPDGVSQGEYTVTVTITRGDGTFETNGQVVFLDYRGGQNIEIPNVGVFDLNPFDAADLGPFTGQTAQIEDGIEAVVRDRYADYDLTLLNSDDDAEPAAPHSTVYFGGRSVVAFAISEQIDTHNADPSDVAIVFTESYSSAFSGVPTTDEVIVAVGNTVAHEIGHLLGLVHTADCDELMDSTCSNDALLVKQTFGLAPLQDAVFPVGMQDAAELLGWVLGLAP